MRSWERRKQLGEKRVLRAGVYQQAKTTKRLSHPLLCVSPRLVITVPSVLAIMEGIYLFPHSCLFWKPVVLSSKSCLVELSHNHIIGIADSCWWLSLGFSLIRVACEDWGQTSWPYVHLIPTSPTNADALLSPAIPKSKRGWWQRRVVSPRESGRQVRFISVRPSVQLAFLLWPTILTLSAALTSDMPF